MPALPLDIGAVGGAASWRGAIETMWHRACGLYGLPNRPGQERAEQNGLCEIDLFRPIQGPIFRSNSERLRYEPPLKAYYVCRNSSIGLLCLQK